MNINSELFQLEEITGLTVYPDETVSSDPNYITFAYADERPELSGDDEVYADTATIYVSLYTDMSVDHMFLKDRIKNYLEDLEMCTVSNVSTMVDDMKITANSVKQIRRTLYICEITRWR